MSITNITEISNKIDDIESLLNSTEEKTNINSSVKFTDFLFCKKIKKILKKY